MFSKSTISYLQTLLAIALYLDTAACKFVLQRPIGLYQGGQPSISEAEPIADSKTDHLYKFTLPTSISDEEHEANLDNLASRSRSSDELIITWDATTSAADPATLQIDCWDEKSSRVEEQDMSEPAVTWHSFFESTRIPAQSDGVHVRKTTASTSTKPTTTTTRQYSLHLHPYEIYHTCRIALLDLSGGRLAELVVLMDHSSAAEEEAEIGPVSDADNEIHGDHEELR